jgi:hypothetical protein
VPKAWFGLRGEGKHGRHTAEASRQKGRCSPRSGARLGRLLSVRFLPLLNLLPVSCLLELDLLTTLSPTLSLAAVALDLLSSLSLVTTLFSQSRLIDHSVDWLANRLALPSQIRR